MLDDNLYIEPIYFKSASEELPLGEPVNWDHEVTKHIQNVVPFVAEKSTVLQFHKKDEKAGYGYGSLIVNNSLIIPIIIYKKMGKVVLGPLDVFNYEGKWFPLTQERVEKHLFSNGTTDRIAKPEEEVSAKGTYLSNRLKPPTRGREVLASVGLLDAILPTARRKDLERVINSIEKEARLLAKFRENDTFSSVRKIASAAHNAKGRDNDKLIREALPINVVEITKTASGYKVTATSDYVFRPETFKATSLKIKEIFGSDVLKEASTNGYAIIESGRKPSNVYISDDLCNDLTPIVADGECTVKIACNKELHGKVINCVLDTKLNKTAKRIFTNGDVFAYQDNIVGKDFEANTEKTADITSHILGDNTFGAFVYTSKANSTNGNVIALEPMKVDNALTKTAEGIGLQAETILGQKIKLIYTPHIETIMEKDGTYYIPSNMKFMKLGTRIHLETNPEQLNKVARLIDANENKLDIRWTGLQYNISGMDDCDILDSDRGLIKSAALGVLVKLGSTLEEANVILDRARKYDIIKVAGFRSLSTPGLSIDHYDMELINKIKIDTVKLAAFVQDEETVDKVLSLNFVTPENLKMFVDYIPAFEDSVSNLASMLVASRLGMKEVEEEPIKQAMNMLDKVLMHLKEIFNVEDTLKNIKD